MPQPAGLAPRFFEKTSPLRILLPINSFGPGGVERVALRLAEAWQSSGHKVTVLVGRQRGPARGSAPALDYRSLREPVPTERWETLWLIWCTWRVLRRGEVDVLFCAGNVYTIVAAAMRLLLRGRCPPVLVKISNDLVRADMGPLTRWIYHRWLRLQGRLLDRFVALAPPMRAELEHYLAVPPERVCVIPDPALSRADLARHAAAAPAPAASAGCRYLALGRLSPQKNPGLLVEAFAAAAQPGDTLTIAGEGPLRPALERRIAALGLGQRVTLAGHAADVAPLLAAADVLVLASDYEGVPAVVLEALAAGVPVAATDCCVSMGWLLGDGAFGALAQVGNAQSLARAMQAAAALDPPRAAMRAFASKFTLEQSGALYLREMHSLADSSMPLRAGAGLAGEVAGGEAPGGAGPSRWSRWASIALSVLVIVASLYQVRTLDPAQIMAMLPGSGWFWLAFVANYLVGPMGDWVIFRRLWGVGWDAVSALFRKLIYNELLVGYLGEVHFYAWAKRALPEVKAPFGAVKDAAVLSAVVGNVLTLVFLAAAFPFVGKLPLHDYTGTIFWSLAFVIGTSLAAMLWRGAIFSLPARELAFVSAVHIARIVLGMGLMAWMWHLVLPQVALVWWLVLATIRMLISRLPFVPNKDVVFAGVAVLAVGPDIEIGALMAMMAGLVLIAHLVVGLGFAIFDLGNGEQNAPRTR